MDEDTYLAQRFKTERPHRAGKWPIAGSGRLEEVDDAVQESWLRLCGSDTSSIANLGAWLMTVVARVCLDMLRARNVGREESPSSIGARSRDGR
jgi:DNA-directed RNA polymerase specialized sigma24 family protein